MAKDQTLLMELARRRNQGEELICRYDENRQITQVLENEQWVDSWDATVLSRTKKADIETGEDQKGE